MGGRCSWQAMLQSRGLQALLVGNWLRARGAEGRGAGSAAAECRRSRGSLGWALGVGD